MVKTKSKKVFTENSMFLFVSFLFLGEDFSHFCRLLFLEKFVALGGPYLREPLWSKIKIKNK